MKRAVIPTLLFVGLVFLSALYYLQIVYIDKPMAYGFVYGIARVIPIFSGFAYFWVLVRQIPFLNNIRKKINQYPSARNRGGFAIALVLGIVHIVVVSFGTVTFNQYLLNTSGEFTNGIIRDCRLDRKGEYCLYQYIVNDKSYQVSIFNRTRKYKEQDTIIVLYYPKLPAISVIKE